jgi:hypothetical protein
MKDIMIEILEMVESGYRPATIAYMLDIPLLWVYEAIELEAA